MGRSDIECGGWWLFCGDKAQVSVDSTCAYCNAGRSDIDCGGSRLFCGDKAQVQVDSVMLTLTGTTDCLEKGFTVSV